MCKKIPSYINFYTNNNERVVKVCFNEDFINISNENMAVFEKFNILLQYIRIMKRLQKPIICCCIGKITRAKKVDGIYSINIHPDRWQGFTLNGLGFYEVLSEVNSI